MAFPELRSTIGWLDFSEKERRQAIELVALFRIRETRDELGIGSIRDAFAEMLFPGTTTLQTRARYFLFVPWLYQNYERLKVPSSKVEGRLRNDEIRLIQALQEGGETDGVIGRISGASLHRFPASIYWNGLRRWGILRFDGDQAQHRRASDRLSALGHASLRSEDAEPTEAASRAVWDPKVPPQPKSFPAEAEFALTRQEAEYLRDRLDLSCSDSLLAHLVRHTRRTADVGFPWMHPDYAGFPSELRTRLEHARHFSLVMHGAALLYNLMLSELRDQEEWVEGYRTELAGWQEKLKANRRSLEDWDRVTFWGLAARFGNVPPTTRRFVEGWLPQLLSIASNGVISKAPALRAMIRSRETWLKRGRSRFTSQRHRELWTGAAGAAQLDFRWGIAGRIVNDILEALEDA
jgi:hypothetical protein